MEQYYIRFSKLLENEDRYGCIKYAKELLDEKKVGIVELYQNIIKPSLQNIACKVNEKNICVWQEHIRSAIVRTVVEFCYTYVVDETNDIEKKDNGKVVILCPKEEYNDTDARMISDFFVISGYDSIFVGSDTPRSDFLAALEFIKPDYIVISVSNPYNLFATRNDIENIKQNTRKNIKVIVTGDAFKTNVDAYKIIGADILVNTFEDIQNIGGV